MQTSTESNMYTKALKEQQMKNAAKIKAINNAKKVWYRNRAKKIAKILLITIGISLAIFFPKQTGYIIGKWMNDFFGTIAKESVK